MKISSTHKIKCDREQVWERLMDFKYLSGIIPGGDNFEKVGDHQFKGTLSLEIGPLNDKINLTLTRKKIREPNSLTLNVYAKGKVNGELDLRLKRKREFETELTIKGKLKFPGVPGIFGFVVGEISKKLKKTIKKLVAIVEADCQCKEKRPPTQDTRESVKEASKDESQYEQEFAGIISKARDKLHAEITESLDTASAQLKADMLELIKKNENERK